MADKRSDLAGPGIGSYADLEQVLPRGYDSLLTPRETQRAIFAVKQYIEENLCRELNLMMVTVPLIVGSDSGVNDMLDRDGSRTPVQFHISNDRDLHPVDAQVVQAATKWKRVALRQFGCEPGEGICTDMRAVRKDYFLDHDHSCYVDQWDWERVITDDQRNLGFLTEIVGKIWRVLVGAERYAQQMFPVLKDPRFPEPARGAHLPARRGTPRDVPRPAAQAARDRGAAALSRGLHHRDRLAAGRRLSARDARRRLRRLGHRHELSDGEADARPERRHPGLESRHRAPSRADLDGHPGYRADTAASS